MGDVDEGVVGEGLVDGETEGALPHEVEDGGQVLSRAVGAESIPKSTERPDLAGDVEDEVAGLVVGFEAWVVVAAHHFDVPPGHVREHVEELVAPPDALAHLPSELELQCFGLGRAVGVVDIDEDVLALRGAEEDIGDMVQVVALEGQHHRLGDDVDDVEQVVQEHQRGELAHGLVPDHRSGACAPVVALRRALGIPLHGQSCGVRRRDLFHGRGVGGPGGVDAVLGVLPFDAVDPGAGGLFDASDLAHGSSRARRPRGMTGDHSILCSFGSGRCQKIEFGPCRTPDTCRASSRSTHSNTAGNPSSNGAARKV
nr:hypothetical protein [Microbacterium sp. UBA6741]